MEGDEVREPERGQTTYSPEMELGVLSQWELKGRKICRHLILEMYPKEIIKMLFMMAVSCY